MGNLVIFFINKVCYLVRFAEAANGGVLQIKCSAPARKLKLDKLPGATKSFCRTHKTFARKLENEERKNFRNFPA